jgi:hypothetical protein
MFDYNKNPSSIYHYCKTQTFIEFILKDKTLKFNSIENSNDPNEYKEIYPSFVYDPLNYPIGDSAWETGLQLNRIIKKTKMICFSTDEFDILSRPTTEGWNLPRMWHTYGDLHRGICIQIKNDRTFIKENQKIFDSPLVFNKVVEYNKKLIYPLLKKDKFNNDDEARDFLIEDRNQYFFQKHIDWKGEREFRIITLDKEIEYLNFSLSVEKIILGERCPEIYKPFFKTHFRNKLHKIEFHNHKREYHLRKI